MKLIIINIILTTLFLSQASFAQNNRSAERVYKECGIGGILFGNSSPIAAVVSNVTSDLGTTAATSNSMSPDTCTTPKAKNLAFIAHSYDLIVANAAKGQGKYLAELSNISHKSTNDIRTLLQTLVTTSDYTNQTDMQKTTNLYNTIM